MKKIIISFICAILISGSAFAKAQPSKLRMGIMEYKKGNFIGSMQTMQDVVAADPGNTLAHYYLAISYVKVGKVEDAKKEYQKVITLNPSSEMAYYANLGLQNLNPDATAAAPGSPPAAPTGSPSSPAIVPPVMSNVKVSSPGEFMSQQVKDTLLEKNINSVINDVNQKGSTDPARLKKIENFSKNKSENSAPSNEDVLKAVEILSQAGLNVNVNPAQAMNPYQNLNPEMMQLNMMMGMMGGNNNMGNGMNSNSMNMMPLMMMLQNPESAKNMDPQLMQTMITGMIMPDMFSLTNNNNNNNN